MAMHEFSVPFTPPEPPTDYEDKYGHLPGFGVSFPEDPWIPFTTKDGYSLRNYHFPSNNPKASLVFFHGLGSHSSQSILYAQELSKHNVSTFALDQRGHGKSPGRRGYINSFRQLIQDSIDFTLEVYKRNQLPIILAGGSMGGTLAIEAALSLADIVSGLILISPAIGFDRSCMRVQRGFLKILSCCCPRMEVPEAPPGSYTRYSDAGNYMDEDVYMYHGRQTVRAISELFAASHTVSSRANRLKCSTLVFFGDQDQVTSFTQCRTFFDRIPVDDKKFIVIEGGGHSLAVEPGVYTVVKEIEEWVRNRVK